MTAASSGVRISWIAAKQPGGYRAAGSEPVRASSVPGIDTSLDSLRRRGQGTSAGNIPAMAVRRVAGEGGFSLWLRLFLFSYWLLRLEDFIDNRFAASIRGDDSVYGRISA